MAVWCYRNWAIYTKVACSVVSDPWTRELLRLQSCSISIVPLSKTENAWELTALRETCFRSFWTKNICKNHLLFECFYLNILIIYFKKIYCLKNTLNLNLFWIYMPFEFVCLLNLFLLFQMPFTCFLLF